MVALSDIRDRDRARFPEGVVAVTATQAEADRHALLREIERLSRRLRARYCGCAWCCATVPDGVERGSGHGICPAAREAADRA